MAEPEAKTATLKEVGGFELIAKIGAGAMGSVFKARQKSMDRTVAVKILPPSIAKDSKFIERFLREARTSAKFNHPNVVQGIEVGCDKPTGLYFFAMEFVDGPTLKKLLAQEKVLPEKRALKIARDIASALECAQREGIVHRDIKPENILLTSEGMPKLADLGLAKQTSSDDAMLTLGGQALGTPHYMAPEQVKGDLEVDVRTDIYALGATLFHVVTGQTPFSGPTSAVIMAKHLSDPVPSARSVNTSLSEPCSRLISRMMQKDRNKRPQTATALLAEIDKLLQLDAPTARQQAIRTGVHPGVRTGAHPAARTGMNPAARTGMHPSAHTPAQPVLRVRTTGPRKAVESEAQSEAPQKIQPKPSPAKLYGIIGLAVLATGALLAVLLGSGKTTPVAEAPKPEPTPPKTVPTPPPPKTPVAPTPAPLPPVTPAPTPEPVKAPTPTPEPPVPVPSPTPEPKTPTPEPTPTPTVQPPVTPPANTEADAQNKALRARFLTQMLDRYKKLDGSKLIGEMSNLAQKPEFAPVREIVTKDVKDLERAVAFEIKGMKALGAAKGKQPLPPDKAEKYKAETAIVDGFSESHGLSVSINGAGLYLRGNELSAELIIAAVPGAATVETVNYYLTRAAISRAEELLEKVSEAERPALAEKLALLKTGEAELKAEAAYAEVAMCARLKNWKFFVEKAADFKGKHGTTDFAKSKAEELAAWQALADAALNPWTNVFHAKSVKTLPEGFVELAYDFSSPEQLKDFACEHGQLALDNGYLKVPAGGNEWAHARLIVPLAAIRRISVAGKTLHNAPRMGLCIFPPGTTDGNNAPRAMCRRYNHMAHLESWNGQTTPVIGQETLDWTNDVAFHADVSGSDFKWSMGTKEVGTVALPPTAVGGCLAMFSVGGDHVWKNLVVVIKPDATWTKDQLAKPKP